MVHTIRLHRFILFMVITLQMKHLQNKIITFISAQKERQNITNIIF